MVLMSGLETRNIPFARCRRKEQFTLPELTMISIAKQVDIVAFQIVDSVNLIINQINILLNALDTVLTFLGLDLEAEAESASSIIFEITGEDPELDFTEIPPITWNPLSGGIEARIGFVLMENDYIDVPKIGLFRVANDPVDTDLREEDAILINSEYLYNNYHFIRSFIPKSGKPNANQYKKYSIDGIPFSCSDYLLLRNNNRLKDINGNDGDIVTASWNPSSQKADIKYRINEKYTNNLKENIITPDGK